uniref:Uncharacterized protein n=1 Tax=Compsopogon caeruleus TaxID=31354 RepID=A0A6T6BQC3_9RHOD|mmetsp:Transcript_173/g.306  ORF Transcript_173/g.306 Transcript_173/m.306 type:complete len:111 (+) Transcript_173:617-949(+)
MVHKENPYSERLTSSSLFSVDLEGQNTSPDAELEVQLASLEFDSINEGHSSDVQQEWAVSSELVELERALERSKLENLHLVTLLNLLRITRDKVAQYLKDRNDKDVAKGV